MLLVAGSSAQLRCYPRQSGLFWLGPPDPAALGRVVPPRAIVRQLNVDVPFPTRVAIQFIHGRRVVVRDHDAAGISICFAQPVLRTVERQVLADHAVRIDYIPHARQLIKERPHDVARGIADRHQADPATGQLFIGQNQVHRVPVHRRICTCPISSAINLGAVSSLQLVTAAPPLQIRQQ